MVSWTATPPNRYFAASSLMHLSLVCGADHCEDQFLSASRFRQDVTVCATEHVVEKQGDVSVTSIPLSFTLARTIAVAAEIHSRVEGVIVHVDVSRKIASRKFSRTHSGRGNVVVSPRRFLGTRSKTRYLWWQLSSGSNSRLFLF